MMDHTPLWIASDRECTIPPDLIRGPSADVYPLAGETNWGHDVFGVEFLRKLPRKDGYKIGVVDTGIDDTHPMLAPNFGGAKDFTGSSRGYRDANGHGTHCSGTVAGADPRIGVFPTAKVYHGKGLSDGGAGSLSALLRAIEWCLSEGCTIVSNSWGGGTTVDPGVDRQLREWAERGIWLIFAGGNSGPNTARTDAPGNSLHVINVAALNRDLSPASFSSAGDKIDTSGPGVGIWSARPGGGVQQMSGTSMACPWVASAHGLLRSAMEAKSFPVPTVYQLRDILYSRSTDTHTPGDDRRTGPGWMTPALLALLVSPDPPPVAA